MRVNNKDPMFEIVLASFMQILNRIKEGHSDGTVDVSMEEHTCNLSIRSTARIKDLLQASVQEPLTPDKRRRPRRPDDEQLKQIHARCVESGLYTITDIATVMGAGRSAISKWFSSLGLRSEKGAGRPAGGLRDLATLQNILSEILG
jgi:hypothetical protein